MGEKKTILIRAPRDIMNELQKRLPKVDNAVRIRVLYNTSAFRIDNWLGQPFIKPKPLTKILKDVKKKK